MFTGMLQKPRTGYLKATMDDKLVNTKKTAQYHTRKTRRKEYFYKL